MWREEMTVFFLSNVAPPPTARVCIADLSLAYTRIHMFSLSISLCLAADM